MSNLSLKKRCVRFCEPARKNGNDDNFVSECGI
jgi:hypothetical protein